MTDILEGHNFNLSASKPFLAEEDNVCFIKVIHYFTVHIHLITHVIYYMYLLRGSC